jgi:hypothetical protein
VGKAAVDIADLLALAVAGHLDPTTTHDVAGVAFLVLDRDVRKRGLSALLPRGADAVLPRLQVGSIEPALWSTLMMTRVAADIAA